MPLLFICAGLLFVTVCARPSEEPWRSHLHNRAYQNYGSSKIRGGTIAAFSPFCRISILIYLFSQSRWLGASRALDYSFNF